MNTDTAGKKDFFIRKDKDAIIPHCREQWTMSFLSVPFDK